MWKTLILSWLGLAISTSYKTDNSASVWFPLPANFNQKLPDEILNHVREQAKQDPNSHLPFTHAYIFGDSGCDTGNLFELNDRLDPDPNVYWRGRFSNGPMWPDYLQAYFDLKLKNYAYGGATVLNSNYANGVDIPDFPDQVNEYEKTRFNVSKPIALVQFVGNDMIAGNVTVDKLAKDIEEQLQWIVDIGEVKHIVLLESSIMDYVDAGFNRAVSTMVNRFIIKQYTKVYVATIPLINHFADMVQHPPPTADPGKWHDAYDSCHNQNTGSLCNDPQNYFRFDLYHPSTVPNYNTGRYIGKFIQNLGW